MKCFLSEMWWCRCIIKESGSKNGTNEIATITVYGVFFCRLQHGNI